jgi:CRP-like cAMP-binding protein
VPAGEIVFEVESIGHEFFIILKGQVSILINLPNPNSDKERERLESMVAIVPSTNVKRYKSGFKGVAKVPAQVHSKVYHNSEGTFVYFRTNLLKDVNTLGEGTSFGEAALDPSKSPLRNATILAKSDCFFAVLDKNNYERIIGERMQQERNRKQSILKNIPHLSQLPTTTVDTLIYFLEARSYSYRDVILDHKEKVTRMYIVYQGSVRLMKKVIKGEAEPLSRKTEVENITVAS